MQRGASPFKLRIGHLIYGAVVVLITIIVLPALGRYEQFDAIEQDFSNLERVSQASRLAAELGERLAALTSRYASGLPVIESDSQRLRQILINLLGNAVKFTDAGVVRLEASAADGMLVFAITDTGAGIASAHLLRLFQEFSQIDNSSTRKHGGTGLGLAISRRMARLLGGDISVRSEPDEGSTFTVPLPLAAPRSALGKSRQPLGEAPATSPRDALARAQSAVAH